MVKKMIKCYLVLVQMLIKFLWGINYGFKNFLLSCTNTRLDCFWFYNKNKETKLELYRAIDKTRILNYTIV